jgi:hypothetical protein
MFYRTHLGLKIEIDEEDFDLISSYKWYEAKTLNVSYATAYFGGGRKNRKMMKMHRLILNAHKGEMIDHIDGNGLNNKKSNLRISTNQLNQANTRNFNNPTGYKGVYKEGNRYRARIGFCGKGVHLGCFSTPEEAAIAYNQKAKELYGENSYLNKVGV